MRNLAIGVAIVSILPLLAEGSAPTHIRWEELSMVVGETVKIALPEGAVVTGMAVGIEPDALVCEVTTTTNRKAFPKGVLRVPRASLHKLKIRTGSQTWVVGMALVSMVIGPVAGAMGSAAAYGAGRLVGRWRWRQIEILP
jgi:hypothetical protein